MFLCFEYIKVRRRIRVEDEVVHSVAELGWEVEEAGRHFAAASRGHDVVGILYREMQRSCSGSCSSNKELCLEKGKKIVITT